MIARLIKQAGDRPDLVKALRPASAGQDGTGATEPDPLQIALDAALGRERSLQTELEHFRRSLQQRLDDAREEGRKVAATEFAAQDAERTALMERALHAARADFDNTFRSAVEGIALELTRSALEKFVDLRSEEENWLARIIEKRIASLERSAIVALHVPPDSFGPDDAASSLANMAIREDPCLRPGTARIELRIGEVLIDPRAGLQTLSAILDGDGDATA